MYCLKISLNLFDKKKWQIWLPYTPFSLIRNHFIGQGSGDIIPKQHIKQSVRFVQPLPSTDHATRRGIILYLITESLSLRPNWLSPPPLQPASVSPPPRNQMGWGNIRLRVREWKGAIWTTGEKAWHSVHCKKGYRFSRPQPRVW